MLRFVHCADLHLDSPFKGIAALEPDFAEKLREAPLAALEKIVDLALQESADFVLIAGDAWDSRERSLSAQLRFNAQMRRLEEHCIPCFYACGNHDPLPPANAESVRMPGNVQRFGSEISMFPVTRDGKEIAHIYGISFTRAAETSNLSRRFSRRDRTVPSIAVLHCNIGDTGHDNYAPCTIADLQQAGMDYWALGHVHKFSILHEQNPAVVYPGCAQGGSPRETGPHGCCLTTIGDDGVVQTVFHPVDSIRFNTIKIAADNCNDWEKLIDTVVTTCRDTAAASNGRALLLRCDLTGTTPLDTELRQAEQLEQARGEINDRLSDQIPPIRIERLTASTRGVYDLDKLAQGNDFTAELITLYRSGDTGDNIRRELDEVLKRYCGEPLTDEEFQSISDGALDATINLLTGGR